MQHRSPKLQSVLALCREAWGCATPPAAAAAVGERIFAALGTPAQIGGAAAPAPLPACRHLEAAVASARASPAPVPALAEAFAALAPCLAWSRRPGSTAADAPFHDGHANALLAGPGGVERRDDVMVGASLLAPGVCYPVHRHRPEELYLVLTPGEWYRPDRGWYRPAPGSVVHHPPDRLHAMRAGDTPLLALWLLWLRPDRAAVARHAREGRRP